MSKTAFDLAASNARSAPAGLSNIPGIREQLRSPEMPRSEAVASDKPTDPTKTTPKPKKAATGEKKPRRSRRVTELPFNLGTLEMFARAHTVISCSADGCRQELRQRIGSTTQRLDEACNAGRASWKLVLTGNNNTIEAYCFAHEPPAASTAIRLKDDRDV